MLHSLYLFPKKKKKPIASNSRVLAKYFGGKLLQNPSDVGPG